MTLSPEKNAMACVLRKLKDQQNERIAQPLSGSAQALAAPE
ncbi:hypothetical protein PCL1606_56220 [Pseudomonas chlororaphis]|uniref:Uncharacterized protein n=1 Tax=Pseudomonas chlororaphis TaxID=587753 RepID=A0A0D5Y7X5_9PSED|nr:hypothetical protein PCL1606_56220 [Pseudomonas chlororaphis]